MHPKLKQLINYSGSRGVRSVMLYIFYDALIPGPSDCVVLIPGPSDCVVLIPGPSDRVVLIPGPSDRVVLIIDYTR